MLSKKLMAAAFVGLLASGSSHALLSFSQIIEPGENIISDDNAELVLKWFSEGDSVGYRAFNPAIDTIATNDILIGMVGITSFPTAGISAALINEISAVYAVQATSAFLLTSPTGGSCGGTLLSPVLTCTEYTFSAATLASASDPLNAALLLANTIYGTNFVTNFANTTEFSFATVLEDVTPDYTRHGTVAESSASATDGTQIFVFDLLLAGGNFFNATGAADITEFAKVPAGANVGSFGGAGTVSYQNVSGWVFDPLVTITGNIQAPGANSPWPIWSDSTYRLIAQPVPEPTTLALLGLGLAGLGFGRRFGRKSVEA